MQRVVLYARHKEKGLEPCVPLRNMDCPSCNSRMTKGVAQVRSEFGAFLIFGWSHQDFRFNPDGGKRKDMVLALPSRDFRRAYYCKACTGLFVMHDTRFDR